MTKASTYYRLTKPGIVRGNVLTAVAGFLLAAAQPGSSYDLIILAGLAVGIALVIASACVCNNYLDRGIDARMERTKGRALPSKQVTTIQALTYAAVLGILGFASFIYLTNALATLVAAVAFVAYVALYGWAKRATVHGTLVGTISGALPPVIGYVALTGKFDIACLLLYVILTAWQLPHFYAIAIYRSKDYAAASIPVLAVVKGNIIAKRHILGWIMVLILTAPLLTVYGYTGWVYAVVISLACMWWLATGLKQTGLTDEKWATKMFLRSLAINLLLCGGFAVGGLLP